MLAGAEDADILFEDELRALDEENKEQLLQLAPFSFKLSTHQAGCGLN